MSPEYMMNDQLLNFFFDTHMLTETGFWIGISICIWIGISIAYLLGIDPLGIQATLNLQRYGFAVNPKHPFADRLNEALENAFDIDDEVMK
jgi:hypothetical protein